MIIKITEPVWKLFWSRHCTCDVIKLKHFPRHWPFVREIHRSPVDSLHKGQWRRALMFFLYAHEQAIEQTIETPVIWDAIALVMTSLQWRYQHDTHVLSNHQVKCQRAFRLSTAMRNAVGLWYPTLWWLPAINTSRPKWNGQHFADDIFKRIFVNENVWISIKISLKFVPKGPINNIASLIQIMAWCRPGDKPLSELMMVRLLTHICVPRPQGVNIDWWRSLSYTQTSWLAITHFDDF